MRSTTALAAPVIALATSALLGLSALQATAAAGESTTTHERGNVIECQGSHRGSPVWVSVYENNTSTNVVQVMVGDDDDQVGNGRETRQDFLDRGEVRARLKLDGTKALVTGTATRFGKRIAVHEERDDAGQHVVVDGYHRRLATELAFTWKGTTVDLDCDHAFFYDLTVTRTDTTGD